MDGQQLPFVSVILPVRNEERFIASCLRSLLQCSYPVKRWEIIIADGMSEDYTREVIARVANDSPVPITVVDNPRRITPVGLNLALARTRGSIIIRVDAHSEYGENYVTRCVQVLEESCAENVGGPLLTRPGAGSAMAQAIALAMTHPFGVGNSPFRTRQTAGEVDTVPYGCFPVDVFQRLGLFDERLARNQDYEMNQRIRRNGGHIRMDPRLQSAYYSRSTLRTLLQQAWANGFWNALTHYLHPYSLCWRHALPLLFSLGVLAAAGTAILATLATLPVWFWPVALVTWLGCAAYLVLGFRVTTVFAVRHGWRLWPYLLVIFPAFHFVYGLGIGWGWLRAFSREFPWLPEDGIPRWEERVGEEPAPRLAA